MHIDVSPMQPVHTELLLNLWQYYQFDSSAREWLDVDNTGRFDVPREVLTQCLNTDNGSSAHLITCGNAIAGFLLLHAAEIEKKPITEFADLFVLPKFRRRGVASAVVDRVILNSGRPWLIAVFRDDLQALAFWRRTFLRRPALSCREIDPPESPEFHEFVVKNSDA